MYHFLLFLIILIYVYEFSIYIKKTKQKYLNKQHQNLNQNQNKESFTTNNLLKYGFYPSNYGENLNYYLQPKLYSKDKNIKRVKPVGTIEDLPENPGLFIKLTDQYPNKRKNLPSYWKCQRSWYDCTSHLPYDLDNYYDKDKSISISEEEVPISEEEVPISENITMSNQGSKRIDLLKKLVNIPIF